MKKAILITAGFLVSSSVFANANLTKDTTLYSDSVTTSQAAYDAGYKIMDNLTHMSQTELRDTLLTPSDTLVGKVKIDDIKITVTPFSEAKGDIEYRASVDVQYNYTAKHDI